MANELQRANTDALIERKESDGEGRTIDLRLLRWGEVAENTMEGIRETFARGAFSKADPSRVTLEAQRHGGPLVGVATEIVERDEDAIATFRVAGTPAGEELLTLAREGVLRDASIVFKPLRSNDRPDGVVERTDVELVRVALLERGAYPSAEVMAVREEAALEDKESETLADNAEATVVQNDVDLQPVMERLENIETKMGALDSIGSAPAIIKPKYDTLSAYTEAVYKRAEESDLLARALTEQTSSSNGGVIPENWMKDVKRIVNLGRRGISAFGGPRPLGPSGTTVDFPYLNSSNTLVASQTEGAEVQTAAVDIAKGSANIVTYAGGSRITYQLAQRSDPSYREAYNRIVMAAWADVTDAAFVTALESGASGAETIGGMLGAAVSLSTSAEADDIIDATTHGLEIGDAVVFTSLTGGAGLTAGRVYWVVPTSHGVNTFRVAATPGGAAIDFTTDITAGAVAPLVTTGEYFRSSLFEASVAVEDATGQPASVVLASTDVFLALAGLTDFVANLPANVSLDASGLATASTLKMMSSGLEIVRDDNVSAGKVLVSNQMAAGWHEDGPRWATNEDASQLGTNVAVYSYGAGVAYAPAGIIEVTFI